jgi:hypothetical protein
LSHLKVPFFEKKKKKKGSYSFKNYDLNGCYCVYFGRYLPDEID